MNWICFRVLHKRTCLEIYSQPWKKYYYGHFHVNRKVLMMAYLKPMGPVIVGNFLTHVWSICTYLFDLFASISCIYFWICSTAIMVAGNFCSIFCRPTTVWLCFRETTFIWVLDYAHPFLPPRWNRTHLRLWKVNFRYVNSFLLVMDKGEFYVFLFELCAILTACH